MTRFVSKGSIDSVDGRCMGGCGCFTVVSLTDAKKKSFDVASFVGKGIRFAVVDGDDEMSLFVKSLHHCQVRVGMSLNVFWILFHTGFFVIGGLYAAVSLSNTCCTIAVVHKFVTSPNIRSVCPIIDCVVDRYVSTNGCINIIMVCKSSFKMVLGSEQMY